MPPTPNSQESVALHNGLRHNTTVRKELNLLHVAFWCHHHHHHHRCVSFLLWFDRLRVWIKWNSCLWAAGILSEILQVFFWKPLSGNQQFTGFVFGNPKGQANHLRWGRCKQAKIRGIQTNNIILWLQPTKTSCKCNSILQVCSSLVKQQRRHHENVHTPTSRVSTRDPCRIQ